MAVTDARYRLLPVFSRLLEADRDMAAYIAEVRKPYEAKLGEKLAVTEGLLYRRGNFNGSFDEVILQASLKEKDAEIAFSPGFRWGTTPAAGGCDHARAPDGPDGDHVSAKHVE